VKAEDLDDDQLFDRDAPITSYVQTVVQRHNAWLETLLRALPVGGTLCVHDLPVEFGDPYTATTRYEAHVLGPDGCDAGMGRTQYGPKPAWLDNVKGSQ
jgi:hypothetical protein